MASIRSLQSNLLFWAAMLLVEIRAAPAGPVLRPRQPPAGVSWPFSGSVPFTNFPWYSYITASGGFPPATATTASTSFTSSASSSTSTPSVSSLSQETAQFQQKSVTHNAGPIAGGILGGVAFVAIIAALFFCLGRRKRRAEELRAGSEPYITGNHNASGWLGPSLTSSSGGGQIGQVKPRDVRSTRTMSGSRIQSSHLETASGRAETGPPPAYTEAVRLRPPERATLRTLPLGLVHPPVLEETSEEPSLSPSQTSSQSPILHRQDSKSPL